MDNPAHPDPAQEPPPPPEEKLLSSGTTKMPAVPSSGFWKKYGWINWLLFLLLILEVIGGAYVLSRNQASKANLYPTPETQPTQEVIQPSPTSYTEKPQQGIPAGTICAQDVQQCSDGSWVSRTGPKCEFACPTK